MRRFGLFLKQIPKQSTLKFCLQILANMFGYLQIIVWFGFELWRTLLQSLQFEK